MPSIFRPDPRHSMWAIAWFAAGIAGSGCTEQGMRVKVDHDPAAKVPASGTYAYLPEQVAVQADPRVDQKRVEQRVETAVDNVLAAKGYRKGDRRQADFLVGYHVVLDSKVDPRTLNEKYGYGENYAWGYDKDGKWGFGPDRKVDVYERGALVIDVVDPQATRLLWRGSAETQLQVTVEEAERAARVNEAVRKILERFPPTG